MQIENGILEFPIEHIDSGYAYAYVNKDGKGYMGNAPFISLDYETLDEVKKAAYEAMRLFGIKEVHVFKYDENIPEYIGWDYVKKHLVMTGDQI